MIAVQWTQYMTQLEYLNYILYCSYVGCEIKQVIIIL